MSGEAKSNVERPTLESLVEGVGRVNDEVRVISERLDKILHRFAEGSPKKPTEDKDLPSNPVQRGTVIQNMSLNLTGEINEQISMIESQIGYH